ncbi:MAG: hypothetical protein O3C10_00750 [Chloroflexi bacterium]|nr:hypothetical protein [Chloroflexota bacterium]
MDPYQRSPEKVVAQQWNEGDPFIGPMRYDHARPGDGPYLVTFGGGRQPVRNGDWIVRDSYGRYSVTREEEFAERFKPV